MEDDDEQLQRNLTKSSKIREAGGLFLERRSSQGKKTEKNHLMCGEIENTPMLWRTTHDAVRKD